MTDRGKGRTAAAAARKKATASERNRRDCGASSSSPRSFPAPRASAVFSSTQRGGRRGEKQTPRGATTGGANGSRAKKRAKGMSFFFSCSLSFCSCFFFLSPTQRSAAGPFDACHPQFDLPGPCAGGRRSTRQRWARACSRPGPGEPTLRGQQLLPLQLGRRPTKGEQEQSGLLRRPWKGARRRPAWPSGRGWSAYFFWLG